MNSCPSWILTLSSRLESIRPMSHPLRILTLEQLRQQDPTPDCTLNRQRASSARLQALRGRVASGQLPKAPSRYSPSFLVLSSPSLPSGVPSPALRQRLEQYLKEDQDAQTRRLASTSRPQ